MKRARLTWVAYAILICSLTTFAQPDTVWTSLHRGASMQGETSELFATDEGVLSLASYNWYDSTSQQYVHEERMSSISLAGDTIWSNNTFIPDSGSWTRSAVMVGHTIFALQSDYLTDEPQANVLTRISATGEWLYTIVLPAGIDWKDVAVLSDGNLVLCGQAIIESQMDLYILAVAKRPCE